MGKKAAKLIRREPAMAANESEVCAALGAREVEFLLVQSPEGSIYHLLVTDQGEVFSALEVVDMILGRAAVVCDAWPIADKRPEARYSKETISFLRQRRGGADDAR